MRAGDRRTDRDLVASAEDDQEAAPIGGVLNDLGGHR